MATSHTLLTEQAVPARTVAACEALRLKGPLLLIEPRSCEQGEHNDFTTLQV